MKTLFKSASLLVVKFFPVAGTVENANATHIPSPDVFTLLLYFFKKMANPGLYFIYFCLFKQTLQFFQQLNVKKCPSSLQHRDSNSQPSDY